MEHSPSREVRSQTLDQEVPPLLWNHKIHYRFYKNLQLDPTMYQIQLKCSDHIPLRYILVLPSHLRLDISDVLIHSGFRTEVSHKSICAAHLPWRFPCPDHSNNTSIWCSVQIMKLVDMQFSRSSN